MAQLKVKDMKKTIPTLLITGLMLTSSLIGCKNTDNSSTSTTLPTVNQGERIDEDLTVPDIIDDNYRNFYEIYVGSYYDTNNDGVGDIKGVIEKLDYISDLGYTGIWLMPIFKSNSYHKYDADSYYEIDPKYGTLDDTIELINKCHEKNIKIIFDLMINHSSRNHPWFVESASAYAKSLTDQTLTDQEKDAMNWYNFDTEMHPGWSSVGNYGSKSFYVESNFSNDMPEFNLANDSIKNKFNEVAKYWLDLGVDGFRLDAVLYYFYNSQKDTISYLSEFVNYCKSINENVYIVGEAWVGDQKTIGEYYTSGITSLFNFPASGTSGYIGRSLDMDGLLSSLYLDGLKDSIKYAGETGIPAPFLDNHDMSRIAKSDINYTKMIYGLLAMMNGTTFTYYGDEIGMNGYVKPDQNVRTFMYWDDGEFEGKCKNPVGTAKCEYVHDPAKKQIEDSNSIYAYYKKANLLRNQNKEIARGKLLETSNVNKSLVTLDKEYEGKTIQILINLSTTEYKQIVTNKTVVGQLVADNEINYIGKLNNDTISLPPYGIAILR